MSFVRNKFASRLRQMSIRSRLTVRYVAVLSLTLLAYGIFVNLLLVWNVWNMIDRDLAVEAQELYPKLNLRPGVPLAEHLDVLPDVSAILPPDTLAQVMGPDGQVVARSANFGPQLPRTDEGAVERALAGQPVYVTVHQQGLWLRVYLMPLTENGRVIGLLWAARSMQTLGAALDLLQALLVGIGLLALLSAGAWGWMLARNSLRPMDDLTRTAHAIGQTEDFARRVEYSGPPDEIGRLAATFNSMLASLQAAHQHTESALAAQRRFVADASHELRTPLTSLRGNAGILRQMLGHLPKPPADVVEILADMDDELARLSRLVDGLLVLARADAGQHLAKSPMDLGEVVAAAFRQAQKRPSQVSLHFESQSGVIVSGSADQLTQLILILLDNAMAYTPAGGQVTLRLRREGNNAALNVTDTGVGIDADDLHHIFERFYRGRAARAAVSDGSGLGLAIAHWIVEEHGGQIMARSEAGKGSSFTVNLPTVPPQ